MADFDFDWVDAFSDRAFGGNGCAVVHGGAHLPLKVCQSFVRETSLVECTFTGPSSVADLRVRYFMADREIPFAGHPTLATAAALRDRGLVTGDTITFETGAGTVPVSFDRDMIEMTQIAPSFGQMIDAALIARVIRLPPDEIVEPPQMVSTGLPFCIAVLRDRGALQAARLDLGALREFRELVGNEAVEPFLVTLGGASPAGDTFSRLLLAPPSPPEDAFTGSATGAMAAFMWNRGLIEGDEFIAEQGHGMNRPGQARVRRVGTVDAMNGIKVAGRGFVLMRGRVDLPDGA